MCCNPKAFCLLDCHFAAKTGAGLVGSDVLMVPVDDVDKCWLTFRTQKNGNNGEAKLFAKNANARGLTFVRAMHQPFCCCNPPHDGLWLVLLAHHVISDGAGRRTSRGSFSKF